MSDWGIYAGDTDKTIYVWLQDATTGLGKTGLTHASSGIVLSYVLPAAARAAITPATQTVTGAHSDGGFVEIDATNIPGLYRLDLPDAAIASGAYSVIGIKITGVKTASVLIPLHVRKVNATQFGGAPVTATTSVTIPAASTLATTVGAVGSVTGAVGSVTGNVGGNVVGTVASVVTKTGYSLVSTGLDLVTTWAVNITGSLSGAVGSVTGAVGSVTGNVGGNVNGNVAGSVASVTGNVGGSVIGNLSGSVGSVTGAVGSVTGSVGSVTGNVGGSTASVTGAVGSVTGDLGGDVAGKVLGGGAGTISGDGVRAASVTGAVGSVTGAVGSVVADVNLLDATQAQIDDLPTNAELDTAITAGLTAALTEGYRATGATGSVRDLLYEILQNLTEFANSGTTRTVKKLDGSTTAKTYTYDDATTPTSITETT